MLTVEIKKRSTFKIIFGNRYLQACLVVVLVSALGAYQLRSSNAAIPVTGRVTLNGNGVGDIYIDGCGMNTSYGVAAATASNGTFTLVNSPNQAGGYCVRVPWTDYLPATDARVQHNKQILGTIAWPPATSNRPEHSSAGRYEFQVAGLNCYHAGSAGGCNPSGSEQTWDLASDNSFNFNFVTPVSPPPGGGGNPSGGGGTPSGGGSTPSGGSTGGSTSRPSSGSTGRSTASSSNPSSSPTDTTPPSTPGNLSALSDDENKTVKLTWDASTDNVSIAGYTLERSTDQQNWTEIASNLNDTKFEDNSVAFGSTFYYRVKATDTAGNSSDYSTAQVTTSDFSANVHPDKDSSVDSEDGVVSVNIPSGAVSDDVFCNVQVVNNVLSPDIDGYQLASGPYQINCRKQDGTVIATFSKSLSFTVKLSSNPLKKAGKLAYYGQKDTNWDKLKVTGHNKKAKTDTVSLDGHQIFTIMKQHKKKSVWVIFFEVLLILGLIVAAVLGFLRFRMRRQLQSQYDDYLHKSRGF